MRTMPKKWLTRVILRREQSAAAPDWAGIESYSELHAIIPKTDFPSQRAFVERPLERFLELVAAEPGAVGARIMEHACARARRYSGAEAARGGDRPSGWTRLSKWPSEPASPPEATMIAI